VKFQDYVRYKWYLLMVLESNLAVDLVCYKVV
jgi:hypothetical protein